MGLNFNLIGKEFEPVSFRYTEDDIILYALGIGANVETELEFIYEKNLKVFPTFAVVPPMAGSLDSESIDKIGINVPYALHGEHAIELHNQIPIRGTIYSTGKVDSIYDKGESGAAIHLSIELRDEKGTLLSVNRHVIIDRSAGNFGGERGPKSKRFDPPEKEAPSFQVSYKTSQGQAALYRLSGDKNLHHIDPEFARLAGFEHPILHGLCTFGFAGRAILHSLCNGDPFRFIAFSARFMNVVYPGDTLITEGWEINKGTHAIRTVTQDGKVVLGNAVAKIVCD
jgi:acyl dehydratase